MTLIKDPYASKIFLDMDFGYGRGATLLDKSSFHTHMTHTSSTWTLGVHEWSLVLANPCNITLPATNTQIDFTSEDFSVVAKIKPINLNNNIWLPANHTFNVSGWNFGCEAAGTLSATTYQSGASQTSRSTAEVTAGNWFTVGCSRAGTSIRLYVNGVDVTDVVGTHINPAARSDNTLFASNSDVQIEFLHVFGGISLPITAHAWYHNVLK